MKILNLLAYFATAVLVFSSCSTNETLSLEGEQSLDLLKSYTIQRDASGAYSLDYNLNSNAEIDNVTDVQTNTNEIYLYSSYNESSRKMSQDLFIDRNQIKVGFVDTNTDKKSTITVIDNDIKMSRSNNERLETFGLTGNNDGTYDLDFKVIDGVAVEFMFDGDKNVYEVHLNEDAKASQSEFLQTFTKEDGIALNIEFVNNSSNTNSRVSAVRRPVVIIND